MLAFLLPAFVLKALSALGQKFHTYVQLLEDPQVIYACQERRSAEILLHVEFLGIGDFHYIYTVNWDAQENITAAELEKTEVVNQGNLN